MAIYTFYTYLSLQPGMENAIDLDFLLKVLIIPHVITTIKRFHDFNKSALFTICVYYVGGLVMYTLLAFFHGYFYQAFPEDEAQKLIWYFDKVSMYLLLLVPAIIPGSEGKNKYNSLDLTVSEDEAVALVKDLENRERTSTLSPAEQKQLKNLKLRIKSRLNSEEGEE